jgi:hypothetical protein
MAGMQGLGRVFDVLGVASGNNFSMKNASAVTFIAEASGACSVSLVAATAFSGGTTANWTVANGFGQTGFWYQNIKHDGTGAWTKQTSSWSSNTLTLTGTTGQMSVFTVYTSQFADTYDYLAATFTNATYAVAILHDLTVARTPANLALLGA